MTATVVAFGVTGYTGRLAVESMIGRGIRPVLAGRRAEELERIAHELGGLEWRLADAARPDSIRELLQPGDVLVTTVGPFERYGYPVAEVAATAGAHYVDSTGEVGFIRTIMGTCGGIAKENGATMLPAFGYDYVPGILAGALAMQEAPAATRLDIGYFATGSVLTGLSQGTRATVADALALPITLWREGRLVDERIANGTRAFPMRGKKRRGFLVSGTEVLFLPQRHPTLQTLEIYNGWFPRLSRAVNGVSKVSSAVASGPRGARAVERVGRLLHGPAGGPDEKKRARTQTHVVAQARDAAGAVVAEVHLEGPSIYTLTGELMAIATDLLAHGKTEAAGVVGPLEAFGLGGLESACAEIGLVRTEQ